MTNLPIHRRGNNWVNAFQEMHRNLDDMFENFLSPRWDTQFSRFETPQLYGGLPMSYDFDEVGDHYLVSMDLPGVRSEDIEIETFDNRLVVTGERKKEKEKASEGMTFSERYYGQFRREIILPQEVKLEGAEANFENGVLQIALQKKAVSKGKSIPVQSSKPGFFQKFLSKRSEAA